MLAVNHVPRQVVLLQIILGEAIELTAKFIALRCFQRAKGKICKVNRLRTGFAPSSNLYSTNQAQRICGLLHERHS
jgi:hypothetical protein